jgi:DnaJ-class molecular chaperone
MDLIYKKEISLKEALCGVNFEILHLNQKKYLIKNDGEMVINNNEIKKISNLGMKRENYIGNLIIEFNIKMPNNISAQQKWKLREIL